jgi:prepilin-type N-terminal cleavage/methylation domain-containing protein
MPTALIGRRATRPPTRSSFRDGMPGSHGRRRFVRSASRDEDGLTLIELLIVLVILPIVVGGISVVIVTSLKDQSGLQARLADSSDTVVASTYYAQDIQSAAEVTLNASPSGPAACSAAALPGAIPILSVEWGTGPTVVSYYYWAPVNVPTQLVRLSCQSGGPPTRVVISHNLATPPQGTSLATMSCIGLSACSSYAGAGGWVPTFDVTDVTIGVTQTSGDQFTLVGSPITGPQVKSPLPVAGSLLLLGQQGDLNIGGGFGGGDDNNVTVNGTIDLNSPPTPRSPAIQFSSDNNSFVSTGQSAGVDVLDCAPGKPDGTTCGAGTWSSCGGCSGNGVNPAPTSISRAVPDPLAGWAQVNQPPTINNRARCSHGPTWFCSAGLYTRGLSIPPNTQVVFSGSPGNSYQFGTPNCSSCSLSLGGSDDVTFGSGVYSFYGGLTVNGENGFRPSPNTLTSALGGVLFYVADGTTDFAYHGSANKVDLTAMSTGRYAGLLFWQDGSDLNDDVSIAGSANSPNVYQGEIYAPNADLDFFGFGNDITTGPVCAQSMVIAGSSTNISIG